MVFGFLGFFLSWRRKVYLMRRKYDRTREKADKQKNLQKRMTALKVLDAVEPTLRILEEQRVSRFDRGRMLSSVKAEIERAKAVLGKDYIPQQDYSGAYQPRRPMRNY
jgi:hypothetical protein